MKVQIPEGFTPTQWDDVVRDLSTLMASESDTKWATGDYLVGQLTNTPKGVMVGGIGNGSGAVIRSLAAATGASENVLHKRYITALKFPPETRQWGVAWTVYRDFANRENSLAAMTKFMELREHASIREAATHLNSPVVVGASRIAESLNNGSDKTREVVKNLTPEAKQALAAELAEDDFLTVNRALEQSSTAKEIDRELARSRKGKEARDDEWCDTQSPLDARALAPLAFDVIPTIEGLIAKIKSRGMDEDAGRHALAYADKITALMTVLRAQVSGDLDPMDADEFDRQVQSILDGVA